MPKFVVLMNENDDAWANLAPSERQRLLEKYFAWMEDLKREGALVGGEPLGSGGRVLRAVDGQVVDGPYTETREVLTGFFVLQARDLDDAVRLARGCPALLHGETVLVRPVGH